MEDRVHIAYCADEKVFAPLFVSIFSLLDTSDLSRKFVIHLIHKGLSARQIAELELLTDNGGSVDLDVHSFDSEPFRGFPRLNNSYLSYGKLRLPEIIDEDKVLYLDANTVVETDVSNLFDVKLEKEIAAVSMSQVKDSYHKNLF